jgi:hypothetical protein
MDNIRQILPATGWRVVSVSYDAGECMVREEPVVCFALVEPPYAEREDGPEQPVVPMIRDRGTYPSKGMGTCDLVIGDAAYWDHQQHEFDEAFVGYLGPDEDLTTPWVQEGIDMARKYWLGELSR